MNLFRPSEYDFPNYREKSLFLMAFRLLWMFLIVFTLLALSFIHEEEPLTAYISGICVAVVSLLFLYVSKKTKPVFIFVGVAGILLAHITSNTLLATPHFADYIWMMVCTVIVFFSLGTRAGFLMVLANTIGIGYFIFFNMNEHLKLIKPQNVEESWALFAEMTVASFILGYVIYQFVKYQTHAEKRLTEANELLGEQNEVIRESDEEKTVLLKEIHHRVKNNLQIIVSLLRMQREELPTNDSKRYFNEAINRILTMSLIHQKMYQEKGLSQLDLKDYVEDLFNEISRMYSDAYEVNFKVNSELENIGLKTIVPFGLLLNELISNSYKHGFEMGTPCSIKIEIKNISNDRFGVMYSDNGTWKEQEMKSGFGLELIDTLTEQLDGSLEREIKSDGTHYHMELRNLDL